MARSGEAVHRSLHLAPEVTPYGNQSDDDDVRDEDTGQRQVTAVRVTSLSQAPLEQSPLQTPRSWSAEVDEKLPTVETGTETDPLAGHPVAAG